jgi:hypothetical protein
VLHLNQGTDLAVLEAGVINIQGEFHGKHQKEDEETEKDGGARLGVPNAEDDAFVCGKARERFWVVLSDQVGNLRLSWIPRREHTAGKRQAMRNRCRSRYVPNEW